MADSEGPGDTAHAGPAVSRRRLIAGASMALLGCIKARLGLAGGAAAAAADPNVDPGTLEIPGKRGLRVLNDRPLNAETPAHLLDASVTPREHFFIRNNGLPPEPAAAGSWLLDIGGEACGSPRSFTLADLKREFEHHTLRLVIECAGNGRHEFNPAAPGNQWTTGAVGCAEWTGVRLRDVLEACGIEAGAIYVAYEGADRHLSGDPGKQPISRGVPLAKAMERESLIAWAMNGAPLPEQHGYPLRLVISGWPGSVSGKWLTRLLIRDRVHDGARMGGKSYRVPCAPVAPGANVADADMCIIASMPVKSLITAPRSGVTHPYTNKLEVRGHAWAGDRGVDRLEVSIDFGATWLTADLRPTIHRLAWADWSLSLPPFPGPGYYEIWARATDAAGVSQPMVVPGWNPKGYLNNACHRIAVQAT